MRSPQIVVLDGEVVNPGDLSWNVLDGLGELRIYNNTEPDYVVERIRDSEIVITNKIKITKEIMDVCPIKYIGLISTGYDLIDIQAANEKGICVCNVPAYSTNAVAQFTFALIFALCHRIEYHSQAVFNGDWSKQKLFSLTRSHQLELTNKILGIIGYGNIGKKVARIALSLDMKIIVYTRSPISKIEDPNFKFVNLETLLSYSDIVSLHCPFTADTKEIINQASLKLMQKHAFLINTSRGKLVNDKDLCQALNDNKIGAYASDVASTEPIPIDNPLLKAQNCIITPHIAWTARETRQRLMEEVAQNLKNYLRGSPTNVVN